MIPPVRRHKTVKAPLIPQDTGQQIFVLRIALSVYNIIRRHNRPRICLFYDDLKALQINLTQCALRDTGITLKAAGLFVVAAKMLYRCCHIA